MPRLQTCVTEVGGSLLSAARTSRVSVLVLVFYTNMMDNLLLTAVVPVIPEILIDIDKKLLADSRTSGQYNNSFGNITDALYSPDIRSSVNTTNMGLAKSILQVSFSAVDENSRVGWLLSSKALMQIIANPIVGMLCNRFGYTVVLFMGTNILLLSSLIYTFAGSLVPLLVARCIQGIGSAATTIAGMSLLADRYSDDKERSKAMGIAMGGSALGVVVGYPFGGFLYAYSNKVTPFVTIATLVTLDIVLQITVLKPSLHQKIGMEGTPLSRLLRDRYILVAAGTVMMSTMAIATLEPTVPLWIIDTMHAEKWQLGLVFLPDSIGYFVGTNFFGVPAKKLGRFVKRPTHETYHRGLLCFIMTSLADQCGHTGWFMSFKWKCSMCCLLLIGCCLACVPLATTVSQLILPHFGIGLGLGDIMTGVTCGAGYAHSPGTYAPTFGFCEGITDAAIMPLLALLVDTRHVAVYGSVYAIAQLAVCLAYGIGPSLAGQVVELVGFSWLMWGIAIINVLFSPLCIFLRNPPTKEENKPILDGMEHLDNYPKSD